MTVLRPLLALLALCASTAWAQAWPSRPIQWIVPIPPGSAPDTLARQVAPRLAARLGQPVVVENRPGAEHNIAMQQVAQSAPEGYMLLHAVTSLATNAHLYKLAFDPIADLAPVAQISSTRWVLVVRNGLAARRVEELVEMARARPGGLSCATTGGVPDIACRMLASVAGVNLVLVPYKGGAQALTDMAGDRVDLRFEQTNGAMPMVRQERIRALATLNPRRMGGELGGLPTLAETYPGFEFVTWQGIAVRAGTPRPVIERLSAELQAVLAEEEVQRALRAVLIEADYAGPAEFGALVRKDFDRYGRLIRDLGVRAGQ